MVIFGLYNESQDFTLSLPQLTLLLSRRFEHLYVVLFEMGSVGITQGENIIICIIVVYKFLVLAYLIPN